MPAVILDPAAPPPAATPLLAKLANLLACPGEVFEELAAAPPRARNWLVPTLLVALTSVVLAAMLTPQGQAAAAIGPAVEAGKAEILRARWQMFSAMTITLAAFAATGWSALVLWFIGRVFLNARFSYWKAVEVVGLTGSIVVLGAVATALLVAASGDAAARPALSLFAGRLPAENPLRAALGALNLFHLWSTAVLAIGLSKLSGVSFKESAFWVFGYWLVFRLALIVLG
jgi:hypothetical protein